MKGFLQRLASSIIQPQQNSHPFAESSYPAATLGSAHKRTPQPESFSTGSSHQPSASHNVSPVQNRTGPTRSERYDISPSARIADSSAEETAWPERVAYTPLLPRQENDESHSAGRFTPLNERSKTDSPTLSSAEAAGSEHDRVSLTPSEPVAAHQPLQTFAQVNAPPPSIRARLGQAPQFVPASSHETRSSDDIQINIGRIEVVAVTQPAPRPAPAPARKGLSLDEYLGRRNGRTG